MKNRSIGFFLLSSPKENGRRSSRHLYLITSTGHLLVLTYTVTVLYKDPTSYNFGSIVY